MVFSTVNCLNVVQGKCRTLAIICSVISLLQNGFLDCKVDVPLFLSHSLSLPPLSLSAALFLPSLFYLSLTHYHSHIHPLLPPPSALWAVMLLSVFTAKNRWGWWPRPLTDSSYAWLGTPVLSYWCGVQSHQIILYFLISFRAQQ